MDNVKKGYFEGLIPCWYTPSCMSPDIANIRGVNLFYDILINAWIAILTLTSSTDYIAITIDEVEE